MEKLMDKPMEKPIRLPKAIEAVADGGREELSAYIREFCSLNIPDGSLLVLPQPCMVGVEFNYVSYEHECVALDSRGGCLLLAGEGVADTSLEISGNALYANRLALEDLDGPGSVLALYGALIDYCGTKSAPRGPSEHEGL